MKKIISLVTILILAFSLFTGCVKQEKESTIKIGASVTPHAEILQHIKDDLKAKGYNLEIVEFTDYVQPNLNLENDDLDANFFQHQPYLTTFNKENSTHITSVASIHYEPMGIYKGKSSDIANLKEGSVIGVPNDGSNEARALLLLEAQGLIKLDKDAGMNATLLSITENPKNLDIKEFEAAQLTISLPDLDLAVINGNYAQQGNLKVTDALALEDKDSIAAETYANILCVKEGNEQAEWVKPLIEALTSQNVADFIKENYKGSVVPKF